MTTSNKSFIKCGPNLALEFFVFKRVLSIIWLVALVGADLDWISKVAILSCD
jgi:hypothetical protein